MSSRESCFSLQKLNMSQNIRFFFLNGCFYPTCSPMYMFKSYVAWIIYMLHQALCLLGQSKKKWCSRRHNKTYLCNTWPLLQPHLGNLGLQQTPAFTHVIPVSPAVMSSWLRDWVWFCMGNHEQERWCCRIVNCLVVSWKLFVLDWVSGGLGKVDCLF